MGFECSRLWAQNAILLANTRNLLHIWNVRVENLQSTLQTAQSSSTFSKGTLQIIVEKVEKQLIIDCLTDKKGNVLQSAKQHSISNRKLGLRIDKYNIDVDKYKGV